MDIKDMVKLTKIKDYTLRYYENIGLIKNVKRNSSGKRLYDEKDLIWIEFLKRLKRTGMKIVEMKRYADLKEAGDGTITERKDILINHLETIEDEIKALKETQKYLKRKIEIYKQMEEKKDE